MLLLKYTFPGVLVLCAVACANDDEAIAAPACVDGFIATAHAVDRAEEWAVLTQSVVGERHYWLSTGAPAYDGTDAVVDGGCDTVCAFGGLPPPSACEAEYDPGDWEDLWRG